jgi:hypothetical protein
MISPKVFQVKQTLGEADLTKLVIVILKNFCDAMNVKESMNALQIIDTANAFIDKYTHSSVDDLIVCLKNAKAGKYGKIYNRLDQQVIFDFLTQYEQEKVNHLENKQLDYKAQEASNVNALIAALPEETKQAILNFTHPERTPEQNRPAIISESEYRTNLIAMISECSEEELQEGIRYFMGKGVKEYITLCQEQLQKRFPKSA